MEQVEARLDIMEQLKQDIRAYYKGILLVILYIVIADVLLGKMCPMVLFTGFPCPACGLTRAGLDVMCLHFSDAWRMNPVIFPIGVFLFYFLLCRYVLQKAVVGWQWMLWTILIVLLIVYMVRMGNYLELLRISLEGEKEELFPRIVGTPFSYYKRNLCYFLYQLAG